MKTQRQRRRRVTRSNNRSKALLPLKHSAPTIEARRSDRWSKVLRPLEQNAPDFGGILERLSYGCLYPIFLPFYLSHLSPICLFSCHICHICHTSATTQTPMYKGFVADVADFRKNNFSGGVSVCQAGRMDRIVCHKRKSPQVVLTQGLL